MKYLVIFEAPCVGTDEKIIEAKDDREACRYAWDKSCQVREYVMGSYDIYRLAYDIKTHSHTLIRVDEGELFLQTGTGRMKNNDHRRSVPPLR